MAWSVMSDVPNPLFDANGDPASGYVLKAYLPGTTTSTSIAINSAGSSPQASITANAEGKWEVSGNEILPYIDRKHKWGIFANSTHASANTPFYMGPFDNVERAVDALGEISGVVPFATVAAAQAATNLASGMTICLADRASSLWDLSSSGTANGWNVIFLTASGLYATLRVDGWANVVAFGADRTGVDDAAPPFKCAMDYMYSRGGGIVFIPEGVFLMASFTEAPYYTVRAKDKVSVFGTGPASVVKIADGMTSSTQGVGFLYEHTVAISDVKYLNFSVDWNGANNPNPNTPTGNTTRMGAAYDVNNLHIDSVWFKNPGGHHNIYISGTGGRNSVTNCVMLNGGKAVAGNTAITDHSGVYIDTDNSCVSGNTLVCENLDDDVATAIEVHGVGVSVQNNIIYGYAIGVISGCAPGSDEKAQSISGNIMYEVYEGVRLYSDASASNYDYVITNNNILIRSSATRSGLGIESVMTSSANSHRLKVSGNKITFGSASPAMAVLSAGIHLDGWETLDIHDNTISNFVAEGIYVESTVGDIQNVRIVDNSIVGCGQTTTAARKRGVAITTGNQVVVANVSRNTITCVPTYGTAASIGVYTSGDVRRLTAEDNDITGQTDESILRSGTDATAITLITHKGAENPVSDIINASVGSIYKSTATSRVWYGVDTANNGSSSVWRSVEFGSTAPVSGFHIVGDRAINIAPSAGNAKSWVCTGFGTPGTWTSEGNL